MLFHTACERSTQNTVGLMNIKDVTGTRSPGLTQYPLPCRRTQPKGCAAASTATRAADCSYSPKQSSVAAEGSNSHQTPTMTTNMADPDR